MTVRAVVQLGDPVLSTPARRVGDDPASLRLAEATARDLVDTMRAAGHSVGVAAPQIGVGMRVLCADVTGNAKARDNHGLVVLIDPEVVLAEGSELSREGCMSVPDLTGDVARATRLVVRGRAGSGEVVVLDCGGFEARVLQHELDHLDGAVFLDRVVSPDRVFPRRRYR